MKLLALSAAVVCLTPFNLHAQQPVNLAHAFDGTKDSPFNYIGQSFLPSATADHISFTFYSGSAAPIAGGTGYLFTEAYTGSPADLSASSPGFLAAAPPDPNPDFGFFIFNPALTLQQGIEYFFYESAPYLGRDSTYGQLLPGSQGFFANSATGDFAAIPESFNFRVGGVTTTPEPSAFLLLGSGMLGGAGLLRRKLER